MAGRKAPSPFALLYGAAVLGAIVVVAVDVLAGAVALLTVSTVGAVYCLVHAERAQARYRRRLQAKVAARPWADDDEVDADAETVARVERMVRMHRQSSRGAYARQMEFSVWQSRERQAMAEDARPRRVVIDRHVPIEEAS